MNWKLPIPNNAELNGEKPTYSSLVGETQRSSLNRERNFLRLEEFDLTPVKNLVQRTLSRVQVDDTPDDTPDDVEDDTDDPDDGGDIKVNRDGDRDVSEIDNDGKTRERVITDIQERRKNRDTDSDSLGSNLGLAVAAGLVSCFGAGLLASFLSPLSVPV